MPFPGGIAQGRVFYPGLFGNNFHPSPCAGHKTAQPDAQG